MTEMREKTDAAVMDWARRIPVGQIPVILTFLAARLLTEGSTDSGGEGDGARPPESEKLLTPGDLAERLNLPESWVRNEERAGRIPSIRLGKYVRFRLSDVERTLAERQSRRP
jgi:excisionase family DNA binding protein